MKPRPLVTVRRRGFAAVVLVAWSVLVAACAGRLQEVPMERDLRRTAEAARSSFDQGDLVIARFLFRRVLDQARLMDDPHEVGNAAYNLALVRAEEGEFAEAEHLLAESEAALRRAGDPLADPRLLRARIAWLRGEPERATKELSAVLEDRGSAPTDAQRLEAELLRGQLACDRKDLFEARSALERAAGLVGDDAALPRTPGLCALAGRIEDGAGNARRAAELFDREASLLHEARRYRRMAKALVRAAEAHAAAEQWTAATDRLARAARSRLAAGATGEAAALVERARALAGRAGDAELISRIAAIEAELMMARRGEPPADSRPAGDPGRTGH